MAIFALGVASLFSGCEHEKYPWGRDTKDSFGNGRFQILRGCAANFKRELVLYDNECHTGVALDVRNWTTKTPYVYVVDGSGMCWKINYRTGVLDSYEKPDAAQPADREIFVELGHPKPKYASGPNTVASFGNGNFQLIKTPNSLALVNRDLENIAVNNVKKWEANTNFIYLIDANGKCWKAEYRRCKTSSFATIDAISDEDRKIFEKLRKEQP